MEIAMTKSTQARSGQSQSNANAQSQDQAKEFFNLHVSGIGYLSRIRRVDGGKRRGDSFLCCAINALHGSTDKPNYSYLDLRVSGEEAVSLVENLQFAVESGRKVLVAFKVGDIYAHAYERKEKDEQNRPTGRLETAALIKGRLLLITMAKVDGEVVYQREEAEGGDDSPSSGGSQEPHEQEGGAEHLGGRGDNDDDEQAHQPAPMRRSAPMRNQGFRDRGAHEGRGAQH